jgi:hypothetical protein
MSRPVPVPSLSHRTSGDIRRLSCELGLHKDVQPQLRCPWTSDTSYGSYWPRWITQLFKGTKCDICAMHNSSCKNLIKQRRERSANQQSAEWGRHRDTYYGHPDTPNFKVRDSFLAYH